MVTVNGTERRPPEEPGRQWSVLLAETGPVDPNGDNTRQPIQFTEDGNYLLALWFGRRRKPRGGSTRLRRRSGSGLHDGSPRR